MNIGVFAPIRGSTYELIYSPVPCARMPFRVWTVSWGLRILTIGYTCMDIAFQYCGVYADIPVSQSASQFGGSVEPVDPVNWPARNRPTVAFGVKATMSVKYGLYMAVA